ncbi:hypothetical protein [Phenylobacterium sp.]|uniref:hypothetical protein n=1 Tax=Phenylobacterium sp. TaxID=1871053 RepID=UPI002FE00FF7
MGPHILVVGGTGMLAGLVEALAGDGGRLSLLSRRASAHGLPGRAFDCDYHDAAAFTAALDAAVAGQGPIDLAVAWFHSLRLAAPRRLAERVGREGAPGRLFQVLGSGVADPAKPGRLRFAAAVADGLPACRLRQVVLGFRLADGGARWLTDAEISEGVLRAVRQDLPLSVVGVVEPWASRPPAPGAEAE